MRNASVKTILVLVLFSSVSLSAQTTAGPTNPKAQKTYQQAVNLARDGRDGQAFESFKKADKQDGGQCSACQAAVVKYGIELQEWNAATEAAQEEVAEAHGKKDLASAHFDLGFAFFQEALSKRKSEIFSQAQVELSKALEAYPNFPGAMFLDGRALAQLNQDDAAIEEFRNYLKFAPGGDISRQRAQRYIGNIALARERMAPAFAVNTLDGKRVTLDDLQGKVVLLDFWATWCAPCREALPNIKKIANKFQGQPLVILSISLDRDTYAWKEFVSKNGMTWMNYWDGGFNGPISKLFAVKAIPHTFTIDADGVLRDEQIGDASIEGRLKKLVAQAEQTMPKAVSGQSERGASLGSIQ